MTCTMLDRLLQEEDGLMSFEWVLAVSLLVIGIVTGVAAARDAIIDEMGDVAEAMLAVDGSYYIDYPLHITFDGEEIGGATDSRYVDFAAYQDCGRTSELPNAQGGNTPDGT